MVGALQPRESEFRLAPNDICRGARGSGTTDIHHCALTTTGKREEMGSLRRSAMLVRLSLPVAGSCATEAPDSPGLALVCVRDKHLFLIEDTDTGQEVIRSDLYIFVERVPLGFGLPESHP